MTATRFALVTGACDGIGQETAARLAEHGFTIIVHGRNQQRATAGARKIAQDGGKAIPVWGDFSSMHEVCALAEQVGRATPNLDVLINNAGMYASRRETTSDGLERTMAVNYFAPWLLTVTLLPLIRAAPSPRVVNVSSMTHAGAELDLADLDVTRGWSAYAVYATSKLANILFNQALSRREPGLCANALHPGVIATKLLRQGFGTGGDSVAAGARTPVHLACAKEVASISGRYFVNCQEQRPSRKASDKRLADALWTATENRLRDYLAAVPN